MASPLLKTIFFLATCDAVAGTVRTKRGVVYDRFLSVPDMIKHSISVAVKDLQHKTVLEKKMYTQGNDVIPTLGGFIWHHSRFMSLRDPGKVQLLNDKAYVVLKAVKKFEKISKISLKELKGDSGLLKVWKRVIAPHCRCPKPTCNKHARYRTMDGSCNNIQTPTWGASNTPQCRFLPPAYEDGVNKPRLYSVTGAPLPSPRLISNVIHDAAHNTYTDQQLTVMMMAWGQFVDHDFVGTPVTKGFNRSAIMCCSLDEATRDMRGSCFPIEIPKNDKHYSNPCMNFVRSSAAPSDNCMPDWRNQLNQQTSFLDASMVYGATNKDASNLRAHRKGYLKMTGRGMMPAANESDCLTTGKDEYCFKAGDHRNMVVPSLTYLHTLFVREHNRIAQQFNHLNPHWDDEKIYQETRKIVAAFVQHITYSEYLPNVLNKEYRVKYGLNSRRKKHNTVYDAMVNPTVANVVAAAAFRFGHSAIPNHMALSNLRGQLVEVKPIEQTFNRPSMIQSRGCKGFDGLGRWLSSDVRSRDDRFLDDGVRNKLFLDKSLMSFDLASLNIQRGRDHGIPSYNAWRRMCGLKPALHFGVGPGGLQDHDIDVAIRFSKLYRNPEDLDLFPAGLSERHIPGGLVGPTFACILSKQFHNFKYGDRFWYENDFRFIGFTNDQLSEIKRSSLAGIVCANTKVIKLQPRVFRVPSKGNKPVLCSTIPHLDLTFWKENTFHLDNLYWKRTPYNPVMFLSLPRRSPKNAFRNLYNGFIRNLNRSRYRKINDLSRYDLDNSYWKRMPYSSFRLPRSRPPLLNFYNRNIRNRTPY